jgi:hypothetical protein
MAYPKNAQLNEVTLSSVTPTLTTGQHGSFYVPFRAKIMKTGVCVGAASTIDAVIAYSFVNAGSTVSVSVLGSSAVTIPSTNSFAGQVTTSEPTGTFILEEGSGITFAVTGSSTAFGTTQHFVVLHEA